MNESKRDRIAARAYEIWEEEGRPPNKAEEHWRRAEQEVAREDRPEQMGGPSEAARAREVDTRPAPPIDAAPLLGEAGAASADTGAKRLKPKSGRPRRPRTERQHD